MALNFSFSPLFVRGSSLNNLLTPHPCTSLFHIQLSNTTVRSALIVNIIEWPTQSHFQSNLTARWNKYVNKSGIFTVMVFVIIFLNLLILRTLHWWTLLNRYLFHHGFSNVVTSLNEHSLLLYSFFNRIASCQKIDSPWGVKMPGCVGLLRRVFDVCEIVNFKLTA